MCTIHILTCDDESLVQVQLDVAGSAIRYYMSSHVKIYQINSRT